MKILIDSGASNSIINPKPAIEKFSKYFYRKQFVVTGLGRQITSDKNICVPLLSELGINNSIHFHVINWHSKFDALIGSDDLMNLGGTIDYKNNKLVINDIEIPFYFGYVSKKITPRKSTGCDCIRIPVSIENGEVIFPETKITENVCIPESVVIANEGYCLFPLDEPLELDINFTERIDVTPLTRDDISEPPKINNQKSKISDVIRTSHLNLEEKQAILKLCKNYHDLFYHEDSDLTFTNAVKHEIRTTDEEPVYVKSFRHPYAMRTEIQNQIEKLLDKNIIRPSISPYSAPVWLVPKKADASGKKKFRLVIDYRKLNSKTIEDKYPLPRIEEILDSLGKCTYFSTLDLAQGFHQIEMHPNSIEKTAFSVNNGHYEYVRMPFGLKSAPSTFQRVMDNVLRDYIYKICFVYMDDIVIFSKSLQEHVHHIKLIFDKLRQFNLKIQLDKSEFLCRNVAFLGHVITPTGIKPNPLKIEAVVKFPIPKNVKEIKSFLGLIGYYRRFISNFAKVVSPFTKCLKKGAKINIDDPDYISAFELCKELLTNAPILAYPDFNKQFKLTTDASNIAIGGVLSQSDRPIAYYSRTLNSAEKNYSTIEKELLAILACTKHFRPYLYGQNFIIETDHNPLVWLYKIKEPNSRLIRWKLKLEEFNFQIVYKKGKDNKVADALSRVEINNKETEDTESMVPNIDELPELTNEDLDQILNSQIDNPQAISNVINELENDGPQADNNSNLETVHSTQEDNGKVIPISEQIVNVFSNRLILNIGEQYQCRYTKPFNKNTYKVTIRANAINEDLTKLIREIFKPNAFYGIYFIDEALKLPFNKICKEIFNYSVKIFISNVYSRDITNTEEQKDLVLEYHERTHNGITETFKQLKKKYFWPKMKETITEIINSCETCLQSKYERQPYQLKFSGPLLAKRPFEVLHLDTFSFSNSKFLTIIDLFSRYAQAYLIKDGTGLTILNKFRHFLSHHNIPQKVVCDEGREFQNNTFKEFCKLNKIDLHFTTVNNPSSNSPIERLHSTILEKLRILRIKNPHELPSNLMISAILIYNQSIHSSTGFSPFHLLYGPYERQPEFDLEMTIFEQYNQKRKEEVLPFYDQVYLKNKAKAQQILEKRNENLNDPPQLEQTDVYVKRSRPRKTDPPYEKLSVEKQMQSKLFGKTQKANQTTAHVKKIKRLRHKSSLQDSDLLDPIDPAVPGPSGLNNKE